MGDLTANFSRKEFACHCCGQVKVDQNLVQSLQALRDKAGVAINIISGYRCPKHNKEVGGEKDSQHMLGKAADITIGNLNLKEMYTLAIQIPAFADGGIGLYPDSSPNFMHVDVRNGQARWAKIAGEYLGIEAALA